MRANKEDCGAGGHQWQYTLKLSHATNYKKEKKTNIEMLYHIEDT